MSVTKDRINSGLAFVGMNSSGSQLVVTVKKQNVSKDYSVLSDDAERFIRVWS